MNVGTVPWAEQRQSYGDYRSFSRPTFNPDCAAVQIDATLYDHQSETRAGAVCGVLPTVEGAKELLLVDFCNADALVPDDAKHIFSGRTDFESHRLAGVRILHGVR